MNASIRRLAALLALVVVAACGTSAQTIPSGMASPAAPAPSASDRGPVASSPDALPSGPGGRPGATPGGLPSAPASVAPSLPASAPPAASPLPSPSGPPAPAVASWAKAGTWDPAKFGFAAKGMAGERMVFVPRSQLPYALETMDWEVVSTVAYFSLEATRDGRIARDGGWKGWNGRRMDRLIERARATGTKVVFSLERFAWSAGQIAVARELLGKRERRVRLAREAAAEVVRRGVDGINVDFEPIPVGLKDEFTDFMRLLRRELDRQAPGAQLTFCVTGHHESYDVGKATGPDAADAVYLMGYHYAGTWSKRAGSNSPMGGPQHDVADSVRSLLREVEPHELIVGLPYYGHVWPTRGSGLNARTQGGGFDVLLERAMAMAANHEVRYDTTQQVAWFAYRSRPCDGCDLRWYQLYFDSPRATEHKLTWLRRREVLGTGVWTIGFEGRPGPHNDVARALLLGE